MLLHAPDLASQIAIALTGATGLLALSLAVVVTILLPAHRSAQHTAVHPTLSRAAA